MKTAAIYARVSSERQKEDQTIASQTAALKAHAASLELDVPVEWVFEDQGYSGGTLVRPALERLRDLAAEVHVEVVLCYSPDRLARKYAYQALLIEEFTRAGTAVRFVKGPRSDTPEDELLLQFQGMIAEYEKAQIAERTRRGKQHRACGGSINVLSGAPYGYRYVRKTDTAEARYEINEDQAAVVRTIFQRYVDAPLSIGSLARGLTAQGIATATGKSRWDRSTRWGMLRNPAYCGRAAFAKTMRSDHRPRRTRPARLRGEKFSHRSGSRERPREQWIEIPVPAIVSPLLFELAGVRMQDNKHFAARRTREPSLLQGLVVCESCGYSYYCTSTRTRARKLYYYRCLGSDDYRYDNGRVCQNRPVRQDYLDALVWEHINVLLSDPELIRRELERRLVEIRSTSPTTAQKATLDSEINRVLTAMHRLVDAYQEGLLLLEELRRRMPALRQREASVRAQLAALDAQLYDEETTLKLAENLNGFLARLRAAIQPASIDERQRILRLVVKEVLVGPDRVVIRHSIPSSHTDPTAGYLLRGRRQQSLAGQHLDASVPAGMGREREGPAVPRQARQLRG